jgi:hypothetical protein
MPGWPVRVYVSGGGQAYHRTAVCTLVRAGQEKARERGHVVRALRCVALVEVRDRRRPCAGCLAAVDADSRDSAPGHRLFTAVLDVVGVRIDAVERVILSTACACRGAMYGFNT